MKKLILIVGIFAIACNSNDIELPNQTLQGQIGGESWQYASANAYLTSSNFEYTIKFLSSQEPRFEDPCAIFLPSQKHLSITMIPRIGSFSIPLPDSFQPTIFHFEDGSQLRASSGFLEVFNLDRNFMRGYIQAVLDDENTLEGAFEVEFCN